MKTIRTYLLTLSFCALAILTNGCVAYLYQAGSGQLEILWNSKPIEEVLNSTNTPDQVKTKLKLVEDVREYSRISMGLKVDDTYKKISMLNRSSLAWNVSASKPLNFEAKLHYFPIVGNVPYLGYFDKQNALAKSSELQKEGWETIVSEVGAYSTLGWFDDPLISTQLNMSDWYLTELVIHECTHATIWIPDDVSFNESFAVFTGKYAARQYFIKKYGAHSEFIKKQDQLLIEKNKLNQILRQTTQNLEQLYKSDMNDLNKKAKKAAIIAGLKEELKQKASEFRYLDLKRFSTVDFNNAYFLGFLRYSSGTTYFESELQKCKNDWSCFFTNIRRLADLSKENRKQLTGIYN